jgi:hypothetical protein
VGRRVEPVDPGKWVSISVMTVIAFIGR